MRIALRTIFVLACVLVLARAGEKPLLHAFRLWGDLDPADKKMLVAGVMDGLFAGAMPDVHSLKEADLARRVPRAVGCITVGGNFDAEQAAAIIDRYYKAHPEAWEDLLGAAVLDAFVQPNGPCLKLPRPAPAAPAAAPNP